MRSELYFGILKKLLFNPPRAEVVWNTCLYQLSKLVSFEERCRFYPMSLVVYITKRCNFSCEFCYAKGELNKSDSRDFEMTVDEFRRLLDSPFGRKALRIGLLGGEPFLNENIFEFFRLMNERRVVSTVVTNCRAIKDGYRNELKHASPTVFGLSLYDNNRDSVAAVAELLEELDILFWMQTVIRANRVGDIENIIRFALDIGCENLAFSNYFPMSDEQRQGVIFDDHSEYRAMRSEMTRKYRGKIKIRWAPMIPHILREENVAGGKKKCQMPFSYVHVDNHGSLGGCCMRPPNRSLYGNVFDDIDPWNMEFYRNLRLNMKDKALPPDSYCRFCECWVEDLYGV